MVLPVGPGCSGPWVGVSVSLAAATAAKDRQPRGRKSSRAALPVILGAAGRAPQRERKPAARLLQRPARPWALQHSNGGNSQRPLAARFPKVRWCFWRWDALICYSRWGQNEGLIRGVLKAKGEDSSITRSAGVAIVTEQAGDVIMLLLMQTWQSPFAPPPESRSEKTGAVE